MGARAGRGELRRETIEKEKLAEPGKRHLKADSEHFLRFSAGDEAAGTAGRGEWVEKRRYGGEAETIFP